MEAFSSKSRWIFAVEFLDRISIIRNNINKRDIQGKNVVNNVDMSSLSAPWQNGTYKNQHTEQHKNR